MCEYVKNERVNGVKAMSTRNKVKERELKERKKTETKKEKEGTTI